MRYIITGGTGLIGQILVSRLARENNEVIVLTRTPKKYEGRQSPGVRYVGWDAATPTGWRQYVEGARAIINLAGENLAGKGFLPSRWTESRKKEIRESRLNAGKAIVAAVRAADSKPEVVIQSSAVGYYGPQGDEEIDETFPPADDFLARICVDWEAATKEVEGMGVRHVSLRTAGIVLNKTQGALNWLVMPFKFFVGGPLGSGDQWYTWIHPEDETSAILFLIDNSSASEAFNVVAPEALRNRDFAKTVGEVLQRPSWFPVPELALRAAFGEVADVVLTGQKVVPKRLRELGFRFKYPTLKAALSKILR